MIVNPIKNFKGFAKQGVGLAVLLLFTAMILSLFARLVPQAKAPLSLSGTGIGPLDSAADKVGGKVGSFAA